MGKSKPNGTSAELNEKLFNALLIIAAEEIVEEEINALPSNEELNAAYPPPPALEKRIRAIIAKEARPLRFKKVMRHFVRAAAVLAFIFTVSAVVLMSIEASRNYIIGLFISVHDDRVLFEFGRNGEEPNGGSLIVGYIPEGFELTDNRVYNHFCFVIFTNADGEQIIIQRTDAEALTAIIDNERRNFYVVDFNDGVGYLFVAHEDGIQNLFMWQYENHVLIIDSSVDVAVILMIAESIFVR